MGWGSVGFPTIRAVDEVRDLEINIENLSELLDSGIRTEFTHHYHPARGDEGTQKVSGTKPARVSHQFPPGFGDVIVPGYVFCVRSTWRLPGVSSYDRGGLTITWIHRRGSSPTQVLRKAWAVNWSPHEANL